MPVPEARALPARDHRDDAGLADADVVLDAERGELLLHHARGAMLLEAELGMGVEITTNRAEFVVILLDVFGGFHINARQCARCAIGDRRRNTASRQ